MADQNLCEKLRDELAELKELRRQIGHAYKVALDTRDFSACGELRQKIRKILEGPGSEISKLREIIVSPELNYLKLKEQYESQVSVAWRSGLFGEEQLRAQPDVQAKKHIPEIERSGQRYSMPTWKEVQKVLRKNRKIIKEKSTQGFTKMLIVPFGYDLKKMSQKFNDKVIDLDKSIFNSSGEKIRFGSKNPESPVLVSHTWDEGGLVYYPKRFDHRNHGGITKEDAIKINGAWQICFVEDMPVIPYEGEEVGGRKQIDRKGSCMSGQPRWTQEPSLGQFKEWMKNKKRTINPDEYNNESGLTPEKYLWMQFTSLLGKRRPILMDYENNRYLGTYLTECYTADSTNILPVAFWEDDDRRIVLGGGGSNVYDDRFGVRVSVDIK